MVDIGKFVTLNEEEINLLLKLLPKRVMVDRKLVDLKFESTSYGYHFNYPGICEVSDSKFSNAIFYIALKLKNLDAVEVVNGEFNGNTNIVEIIKLIDGKVL